jgi:hypothetical protein
MRLDDVDEDAVRKYIEEFRRKGPEPNQPCDNVQNSPFQEPQEESPEGEDGASEETESPVEEEETEGSPSS